ncbi:hypothetical protein [Rhizobium sp. SGZ-381]|uniref:hypothetical protein n=1 Tax=Rhizobium sp. SGZ-381 TaxID=3342800 RepID=UPI00367345F3
MIEFSKSPAAPSPASVIAGFADQGVTLPLRLSDEDIGVVLDADGRDVLTVDSNGERPDEQASAIALMIVSAVNAAASLEQ